MKILCIADIHGDLEAVKKAKRYAEENMIDRILILGDFPGHGVFHDIQQSVKAIEDSLDLLAGFPVLAIPGNCDPLNAPEIFGKRGVNLHERSEDLDGVVLAGFGGSNVTPFGTPFEMEEEEIFSRLKSLLDPLKGQKMILAVHCPPKDTECDKTSTDLHAGSSSIRKAVEEYSPSLVVCSHIHEAGGSTDRIGSTVVANVGRLGNGNVGVINVGREVSIALANMGK